MQEMKALLQTLLSTGLIVAGAAITVPLGPVPFVLSDFFVLLSGLVLGKKYAPISVGLYLLLGAVGLPVFADGGGGLDHLFGPTGGYLFGFLLASFVVGLISTSGKRSLWKDIPAVLSGYLIIYTLGVIWLKRQTGMPWETAIQAGSLDFLVPMAIKSSCSVLLAQVLRKLKLVS